MFGLANCLRRAPALLPFLAAALLSQGTPAAAIGSAETLQMMQRNFNATKVSGFNGSVTMVLINDQGKKRVRKINMWSKLRGDSSDAEVLMRFDEPLDVKGTGFLQIENSAADDDMWVFLPALGKTRRLVASNKRDSFFGTDFSYGDVLLPAVEKYQHTWQRDEVIDGADCHVIESKPIDTKTRDDSGYSRKIVWVEAKSFLERKVEYYDVDGKLLKTQLTFDVQAVEPARQRWMPMRREMVNHQTGHKTLYQFDRFTLDRQLTDSFFSLRSLER
jgi:outer membrane lipoprotein-sorting protein